jgi:hypothetical protein
MKDLLPKYFSSEWSFAQCKITAETKCIVGWKVSENEDDQSRETFYGK